MTGDFIHYKINDRSTVGGPILQVSDLMERTGIFATPPSHSDRTAPVDRSNQVKATILRFIYGKGRKDSIVAQLAVM